MKLLLCVFVGGCIGGLARYWLTVYVAEKVPARFPLGTLAVNFSGSFLLGLLFATGLQIAGMAEADMFALLGIGFLGAFTTVSSLSLQSFELIIERRVGLAFFNLLLTALGCPLLAGLGIWLGGCLA